MTNPDRTKKNSTSIQPERSGVSPAIQPKLPMWKNTIASATRPRSESSAMKRPEGCDAATAAGLDDTWRFLPVPASGFVPAFLQVKGQDESALPLMGEGYGGL